MRDKDLHPALSPRHKMSHFHETETYFSQFLLYIRKRDILSFIHIKSCSLYIKPSLQVVVFVIGSNDIGTKTPVIGQCFTRVTFKGLVISSKTYKLTYLHFYYRLQVPSWKYS